LRVGVGLELLRLSEMGTRVESIGVNLLHAGLGHWFATLFRSPTREVTGACKTRRTKLERSASSQVELDQIAAELNSRPRETLQWRTPAEKMEALLR
jgi:hypothetical protein